MQLIAFVGPKQSGKTLLADYLVTHHGYTKINFKDALIEETAERFKKTLSLLELFLRRPMLKKPYHVIGRALLQEYGTNVRRADNPDYWLEKWMTRVHLCGKDKIVVDDVRFINEAEAVRGFGGKLIRIIRPSLPINPDPHPSETEQALVICDATIINDGTPSDLIYKYGKLFTKRNSKPLD